MRQKNTSLHIDRGGGIWGVTPERFPGRRLFSDGSWSSLWVAPVLTVSWRIRNRWTGGDTVFSGFWLALPFQSAPLQTANEYLQILPTIRAFFICLSCGYFMSKRHTWPLPHNSCFVFNSFYQEIQLENGYHLAGRQTEKHIFVSKTLMIGRIALISPWQCVINPLGHVLIL